MDKYADLEDLRKEEKEGTDFRIRSCDRNSRILVIAPHGGGIEPGTSELAEAIAGSNLSFYTFEGMKRTGNGELHITSTRFDEPVCAKLLARAERVIAIHGENSRGAVAFLGGLDRASVERVQQALEARDFRVRTDGPAHLQGTSATNICNRGTAGGGIQIELSHGLRVTLFQSLTRTGREVTTPRFQEFVEGVRESVLG
jgi:phage replication-related protein YjqB (UPF0714/DUF867 family)